MNNDNLRKLNEAKSCEKEVYSEEQKYNSRSPLGNIKNTKEKESNPFSTLPNKGKENRSPSQFVRKTLEEKNYEVWLEQRDIANIAKFEYGWYADKDDVLFEVIGSANQLEKQIKGKELAIFIINKNANHWVTLVVKQSLLLIMLTL